MEQTSVPVLPNEKTKPIAAIVVTFHPRPEHLGNLAKISAQVDLLIVVDNGSPDDGLRPIRQQRDALGFTLLENDRNFGVAAALNRGIRAAQQAGCAWVTLFDQDSVVTEGFIAAMLDEYLECHQTKNVMQMIPRYRSPETGAEQPVSRYNDGGAFLTITSGSLFPLRAFEACGPFREDLFIYCVDDDYSLRLRKQGFFIGISRKAVLLHESGHPTSRRFLGVTLVTKNYRPEARYYYARNKVWILRTYGATFPRLIWPTMREFVTIPVRIALMEQASWTKIRFFLRGLRDGCRGRMGCLSTAG